jgi:flagellar protein FlaF
LPADTYEDVRQTSSEVGRERERIAFGRTIALLEAARDAPADDIATRREAVGTVQALWRFLIRDLAHPANDLSDELKDNLIAIGLWSIQEADALVAGATNDWGPLIEIQETVRKGLD